MQVQNNDNMKIYKISAKLFPLILHKNQKSPLKKRQMKLKDLLPLNVYNFYTYVARQNILSKNKKSSFLFLDSMFCLAT